MKYILIFAAIVFLVRIDFILNFFDKQAKKYESGPTEISSAPDVKVGTDLVPVDKDLALKSTPRKLFLSMLEDFNSSPDENIKLKAIEILRANPTMFNDKIDAGLESAVTRWRDHLLQKNKETQSFILEMMKSLKGENLEMLKRLLSFAIDADMLDFLNFYSKSSDLNCMLMGYLGDVLPEVEKYNELSERLTVLDAVIASDKLTADVKAYAQRCQIVLKVGVDKLKSAVIPFEDPENSMPSTDPLNPVEPTESQPAQAPTIDPNATPGTTP